MSFFKPVLKAAPIILQRKKCDRFLVTQSIINHMKGKNLFLLFIAALFPAMLSAQTGVKVSGTVYDSSDEVVAFANVFVKGAAGNGTTTDLDGHFSLTANVGSTLVISFIGYDDVEYVVNGPAENVVIKFAEGANTLEELVVVGYGVQKKSVLTSSVSRVVSEDLDEGHPTNLQNALKGRVSGVTIISDSGQPGAGSKIRIRGTSTINDSDPLYIVDGMPSENGIDHLNPTDIESVEILKDAASAAIYGARGANGVVLVTTKEGKKGQTTFDYEFTYGMQNPANKVSLTNAADYMMLINEMAANSGKDPYFTSPSKYDTDWQSVLQNRNAPVINHKASLSGGNDNSNYYISFGYLDHEGIYAKGYSNYERYNFRAKYNNTVLDRKDRDWLNKINVSVNVAYTRAKKTGSTIGNSDGSGLISSMNMLPPTEPVYQEDPAVLADYAVRYPDAVIAPDGRTYNIIDMRDINNPLANMQVNNNEFSIPQNFSANGALNVNILPGLTFKTTYGIEMMTSTYRKVTPKYDLNTTSYNKNSRVDENKWEGFNWQWENILSYNRSFGLHNFGALFGTSVSRFSSSRLSGTDYDLLVVDIDKGFIDTATAAETNSIVSGNGYDHAMASMFGRVNYNYAERYLAEVVLRYDGSSNFADGHRWALFPSVSVGWVLTNEDFMSGRPSWFDFAKFRASWGQNGNERVGSFKYTSMMASGHNAIINGSSYTGMYPSGYANRDLKWETSEQIDLGIDLRFLNNALTVTADWFQKKTKDMLLNKPIPLYTSFSSMTINAGSVKNSGVELEANYRFSTGNVHWGVGANASYIKNVVTDQGPDMIGLNSLGGGMGGQVSFSQSGKPYGFFYGYQVDGVFQTDEEAAASGQNVGGTPHAGDLRFKDVDGNGSVGAEDRTMIGNPNPDWTFGLNLTASWKNFDFSAFFQGVAGNEIFKLYRLPNVTLGNFGTEWLGRWHGAGTSSTMPRLVEGDNINSQISDFFVEDGSYLRFKVAQIGYTLPEKLTAKVGVKALRVFIQGENLFTLTGYSGYDPEVGTRHGLDAGTYPQARTFTAGVNIKF